jgi:hypothetical protein
MLHACVERFDVMDVRENILGWNGEVNKAKLSRLHRGPWPRFPWAPAPEAARQIGSVHLAYNPSYSACFFSRNSIFLSQKISQQCFSAGL